MSQGVFLVVDTETGRYYGCFTTWQFAYDSIILSYCRIAGKVEIVHRDAYNTDVICPNKQRLTIKSIVPMEFVEHL